MARSNFFDLVSNWFDEDAPCFVYVVVTGPQPDDDTSLLLILEDECRRMDF
jgi:hypothetical protein